MTPDRRDPGAFIGHEPELASEAIPGRVRPDDERVAADASQPGVRGEPDHPDAGDVVEGPIGEARLRDPASDPDMGADLEELATVDPDPRGDVTREAGQDR